MSHTMNQQVNIISRKYAGYDDAWINTAKGRQGFTAKCVWVIISIKGKRIDTYLKKKNVILIRGPPKNLNDAVLAQHVTIEAEMKKLADLLALCRLTDVRGMTDKIAGMVATRQDELEADNMTRWIHTVYDISDNDSE